MQTLTKAADRQRQVLRGNVFDMKVPLDHAVGLGVGEPVPADNLAFVSESNALAEVAEALAVCAVRDKMVDGNLRAWAPGSKLGRFSAFMRLVGSARQTERENLKTWDLVFPRAPSTTVCLPSKTVSLSSIAVK